MSGNDIITDYNEKYEKPEGTPKHIQYGLKYGLLKQGYNALDYYTEAAETVEGYETGVIHGVQGSCKSTRAFQYAGDIIAKVEYGLPQYHKTKHPEKYPDYVWESALRTFTFKPSQLIQKLEKVKDDEPLPVAIWDDILCHFSSNAFRTNIDEYEAVDSLWAVIRTTVHVV